MKVIVAGFPKTGTKSMQSALTELGFNVYDYLENYKYLGKEWFRIFEKGGTTEDFRRMFENVDAVTDVPSSFFWDEIHKAFPDAKIILTMRRTEDEWAESFANQFKRGNAVFSYFTYYLSPTLSKLWTFGNKQIIAIFSQQAKYHPFKEPEFNWTLLKMSYRRHNAHVLQNAPKDKLLVYDVKEGWEPLCQFLGVDVPNKPFPHKNVRGNIIDEWMEKEPLMIRAKREIMISSLLLTVLIGYGVFRFVKGPRMPFKSIYNSLCNFASSLF